MPTDREVLDRIEGLFSAKLETPFDEEYDSLVESLSFTAAPLADVETGELKRAWGSFLNHAFECGTRWEWPCNIGIAEWYCAHDMPHHAISVYEHLVAEIHQRGLVESEAEYLGAHREWLLQLFQLSSHQGLTERALHVASIIGDFHDEGFFGAVEYAEVIASIPSLRRREFAETVKQERLEAIGRCRELFGSLFEQLHDGTRRCAIEAEFMSGVSMRSIDPSAAPRCWSLVIESEFHRKVFLPNRVLRDFIKPPLRESQSCSIGSILCLMRKSREESAVRLVFDGLQGGSEIGCRERFMHIFDSIVREHRNRIAHAGDARRYTLKECEDFLKSVRDSRWIIELLSAFQPL